MKSRPTKPGRCISCKKELNWEWEPEGTEAEDDEDPTRVSTNLDRAVDFSGTASYGSGWDTVPHMIVYVCDDCIRKEGDEGNIHQYLRSDRGARDGSDDSIIVFDPDNPFADGQIKEVLW